MLLRDKRSVLLLVRHGQAMFGTDDYDRLSALGHDQSRRLGTVLAAQGVKPEAVLSGTMRRHRETAAGLLAGAGWEHGVGVDPAWDEFDRHALPRDDPDGPSTTDPRRFQAALETGMRRWAEGEIRHGTGEPFADFRARTENAVRTAVTDPSSGGPTVVVTSAGVIGWIVADLLGGGVEQWIRLNRVCLNASVTKIAFGRNGPYPVSFNDHGHLDPSDVTFR
ncbi:histidine phosphatase family protein [Streptomyces cylindrosporus]|uniref:Histidine phosphatase family protein n=1 Tax=Streptomyces cylindrosporus TaxID=2927583 RepID=A0ABS9Y8A4_9ACTN|nr:histidine phosphatase family protein [Streptomyces cylindrosporus]MCI3273453.1 histidine phosphatase family protein [Streptomyces cylindrosporus]